METAKERQRKKLLQRTIQRPPLPPALVEQPTTAQDKQRRAANLDSALDPNAAKQLLAQLEHRQTTFQQGYDVLHDQLVKLQIEESVLRNMKLAIQTEHEVLREQLNPAQRVPASPTE